MIITCKGCGQRHDNLARCSAVITTGPGAPMARDLRKIGAGLAHKPLPPPFVEEARESAKLARPKKPLVVKTPGTGPLSGVKLVEAKPSDDCSNPACPYREEVLGERERQRKKAAAWRERKAKGK